MLAESTSHSPQRVFQRFDVLAVSVHRSRIGGNALRPQRGQFQCGSPSHSGMELNPETREALRTVGKLLTQPRPHVAVGQLWRAERDSEAVLGVVVGVDGDIVDFAPATVDVHYPTAYTVLVNEPLPVPLAVFTQLAIPMPVDRLLAYLGDIGDPSVVVSAWMDARHGIPRVLERDADALEARRAFRLELLLLLGRIAGM